MKRKGRKHLPKAGTRPDQERVFEQSQQDVINFGLHRRLPKATAAVVFGALAVLGVLALIGWVVLT